MKYDFTMPTGGTPGPWNSGEHKLSQSEHAEMSAGANQKSNTGFV